MTFWKCEMSNAIPSSSCFTNWPKCWYLDYHEILQIVSAALDELVLLLQIALVNKSITILVYKVYNVSNIHPQMGSLSTYIEGEQIDETSNDDYGTISLWANMIICHMTKGHFPFKYYSLSHFKSVDLIMANCHLKVKFQTHTLDYNFRGKHMGP